MALALGKIEQRALSEVGGGPVPADLSKNGQNLSIPRVRAFARAREPYFTGACARGARMRPRSQKSHRKPHRRTGGIES